MSSSSIPKSSASSASSSGSSNNEGIKPSAPKGSNNITIAKARRTSSLSSVSPSSPNSILAKNNLDENNAIASAAALPKHKQHVEPVPHTAHPAVTGIFYPNTFFQNWIDFFTLAPKIPNPPQGTYVGTYEKLEMLFAAFVSIFWPVVFNVDLYHLSRNLNELLPQDPNAQAHLRLAPAKWNFLRWFGWTHYDVADHQWRNFDNGIPTLTFALLVYVGISQLVSRSFGSGNGVARRPNASVARFAALAIMNVLFVTYVHGYGVFLLFPILIAHYLFTVYVGPLLPRWLFLATMWSALTGLIVALEWNNGFDEWFRAASPGLVTLINQSPMMRWNAVFNMQMLRLVAFSVDFLEAKDKGEAKAKEIALKHKTNCPTCGQIAAKNNAQGRVVASEIQPLCYKARTDTPRPLQEYSFLNFIAYILYLPLYIAGPVSSFNAFASHIQTPQKAMNFRNIARYAFRIFTLYVSLIIMLHSTYITAMRQHAFIMEKLSPFTQSALMFQMLAFLWLKFSVIWKFFRLFGILDGVEAPEDMSRCFANTVRVSEFWRDWHSSFNLWIVRYMYIPLGGNRFKVLVVFPIFFFIAIWHDSKLELLSWALIMCVNFALELILTAQCSRLHFWKTTGYNYRYYVTVGGVWTIFSLVAANAFGFGTGMHSADFIAKYVTRESGYLMLVWISFLLATCNVSLMDREMEKNANKKAADDLKAALVLVGAAVSEKDGSEPVVG